MKIPTIRGDMDESLLQKKEIEIDNEDEHTTAVEYCVIDCPGTAHHSGHPDSPSHFCNLHVHRSVHVTLKKFVETSGVAAAIG